MKKRNVEPNYKIDARGNAVPAATHRCANPSCASVWVGGGLCPACLSTTTDLEPKKTPESVIKTFPEINALSLRDVTYALNMCTDLADSIKPEAMDDFNARVAALKDRHTRLTHTAAARLTAEGLMKCTGAVSVTATDGPVSVTVEQPTAASIQTTPTPHVKRTDAKCTACKKDKRPASGYLRLLKSQNLPYVCRACLASRPAPPMYLGKLGVL